MTTHAKYELKLGQKVVEEIISHAKAEAPNECCGILAGENGTVTRAYRARNVDRSPVKYTIDRSDTLRIFNEVDRAGIDVLAFYHSHTHTEAYPSVTDVKLAPPSDLFDYLYVIVSLAEPQNPVLRAYHIAKQQVEEAHLQVTG